MSVKTKYVVILAHPGHELRILHWLEKTKPRVYFLTDGSAGRQPSRTGYSRDIVNAAGATSGSVFGTIADPVWYDALLNRNSDFFVDVLNEIKKDVANVGEIQVVSDAIDGYNPMHDMAYAFGTALTRSLRENNDQVLKQLCSAAVPNVKGKVEIEVLLDPEAKAKKLASVSGYTPLAAEVRRILERDPKCFDMERLISQEFDWRAPFAPEWEVIGKDRVAKGLYTTSITYESHVQPVAQRLLSEG